MDADYYRLLDSADAYIDTDSDKTLLFLDSIPKPIEDHIKGRLGEYYSAKALIHDDYKEYSQFHQSTILALKYAEKEKEFCIAGQSCLDLFSNIYYIKKDSSAFKYLDKAKLYFNKCTDDPHGLVQVEQTFAYAKYLKGDLEECNNLLLPRLSAFKDIKDDAYYYMFANYMIATNYTGLDSLENAHKHYRKFKTLHNNTTIAKHNYLSFKAGIDMCFADVFFEKKQMDSTLYYLNESSKLTRYMGEDVLRDYYSLFADLHKYGGNIASSKAYIDSLIRFENKMYESTIDASFQINESLLKAETDLLIENEEKVFNRYIWIVLIGVLLLLSVLYFIFYRKQKVKIDEISGNTDDLTYLKSNNKQLAVKVHGLEEYINNLKKEVKKISNVEGLSNQREKIKELYKNLHINSSTLLEKGENHLELVNDLNVGFFKEINELYPQLNKSEVIICYYLLIGFSNKEITLFLNTTLRSVESRRYRISKKIGFDKKETTLVKHLQETFKDTLSR
ncbi:hypothetical protein [Algibacter sp. 2305UL17-15]|uniref:helix-turn-helix transcriptional regulator n=1 Tax=Algibacter sp. 2305UL17-15 TaxID=3231268 RepID=UPI003457BF71